MAGEAPPLPPPLAADVFDSHCHLDDLPVPAADAVDAARAVGVRKVVTVGYDLKSSAWCARYAAGNPDVYAAVAVHPNDAQDATEETLAEIARMAGWAGVRAVGETGLDFYRDWCDPETQRRSFREHIRIARKAGKALVIHDRDAHDDILRILAEEETPEHVIFHCFSGDADMARICAERGYVMSFAGTVTYKNAGGLREAAKIAPPELILVETDAPYLPPVPHRGKPNGPYLLPLTVRCVAEVKGMDETDLCATVMANGERVFGI